MLLEALLRVPEKLKLLLANLDRAAAELRDQHLVAGLERHWYPRAILGQASWANSQDLGLVELLHARLGKEDAAGGLGLGLDALYEDAVEQRRDRLDGTESGRLKRGLLVELHGSETGNRAECKGCLLKVI